jgi:hypothetical protein
MKRLKGMKAAYIERCRGGAAHGATLRGWRI